MELNKKNLMLLSLASGVMLFFFGIGIYILLGPSGEDYLLPRQVSSFFKFGGMGLICISMIIGGFFVENIEKDIKTLLLIFGIVLLLVNIFVLSYTSIG